MNCISNHCIVITAGVGHIGCFEAIDPRCYVLVSALCVPVYLSLVCFNFIFILGVSGVKCHSLWYRISQQEGNGSS
jgi:hypothetical protein